MKPNETLEAAQDLLSYAESLGFKNAIIVYWDPCNPEQSVTDIESVMDETTGKGTFTIGMDLGTPEIKCTWHENGEVTYE